MLNDVKLFYCVMVKKIPVLSQVVTGDPEWVWLSDFWGRCVNTG